MNVAGALSDLIAIHRVAPGEAGSHLCAAILMASAAWRFSRAILSLPHLCTAQGWSPECGRSSSRSSAHKRQARQTCAAVGSASPSWNGRSRVTGMSLKGPEPDVNSEGPGPDQLETHRGSECRSRRPIGGRIACHSSSSLIVQLKREHPNWDAPKIRERLRHPEVPCAANITRE